MKEFVLLAAMAVASAAACADDAPSDPGPVSVLAPVVYSHDAPVKTWVKQECDIERHLVQDLAQALAEKGLGGATVFSADRGRVLKMTIERVIGANGGGWSGDKTLSVRVLLLRDGQVERTTDESVATMSLNPLAGTCASFERASGKLAGLIVRWLVPRVPSKAAAEPPSASGI